MPIDQNHAATEIASTWLYFKLYVGAAEPRLERLIADGVPRIVSCGEFSRWFFLRYRDDQGLHLRLRLKAVSHPALDRASRATVPILNDLLSELAQPQSLAARPVVLPRQTSSSGAANSPKVETATYEPDTAAFGERGIHVAETVFQKSSESAIAALRMERAGGCSRKIMAPILMESVANAFVPEEAPHVFWGRYAAYWMSGRPAELAGWNRRFLAKAEELRRRKIAVITPDSELDQEARDIAIGWRKGIAQAARAYAALDDEQSRRPGDLAFHFIHLMNNRLGAVPLEEAYFATLLAGREERIAS
jgi:thiopeptide-type bacteriocin biosynthesis protein